MPWPAGLYVVKLAAIEPDDRPSKFGDTPRAKFTFEVESIIDSQEKKVARKAISEGVTLTGWCNLTMGRKATMRGWIEALAGRPLQSGERIEPKTLIGKKAKATLVTYDREDGSEGVKLGALAPVAADDDDDEDQPF
jgi:hypothetical protein